MVQRPPRLRLDDLLVRRGKAPSRERARALVLAGRVTVAGSSNVKPGSLVSEDVTLGVGDDQPYVSRGGLKLAHALHRFSISPSGHICADVGASTGGFTDCLLQGGARRVYAIDVGYGQLHWRLRNDPRVVVMERTNARHLESLPDRITLATVDASFISLRLLLPAVGRVAASVADVVALVKPQFEAGRGQVGKGGVVRDGRVHREVLSSLAEWLKTADFTLVGLTASPIRGPAGNVEFLAHVQLGWTSSSVDDAIELALEEASIVLGADRRNG